MYWSDNMARGKWASGDNQVCKSGSNFRTTRTLPEGFLLYKSLLICLLMALLIPGKAMIAAPAAPVVGVTPIQPMDSGGRLQPNQDWSEDTLGNQISAAVEHRLGKEDRLTLTDRRRLREIIREHKMVQAGLIEGGGGEPLKLVRADFLVTGGYNQDKDYVRLQLNLVETDSGKIRLTQLVEGRADLSLMRKIESSAGLLAAEVLGERTVPLQVTTSPAGARVYVNNSFIGETPIDGYFLPPRPSRISLVKPYYFPKEIDRDLSAVSAGAGKTADKVTIRTELVRVLSEEHPFRFFSGTDIRYQNDKGFPGFMFGMSFMYGLWEGGGWFAFQDGRRSHKIQLLDDTITERKDQYFNYLDWFVLFHVPVNDTWVDLLLGGAVGLAYVGEGLPDDARTPADDVPTAIEEKIYEAGNRGFHGRLMAGVDLLPNSRVGLRLLGQYDFTPDYRAKNGKFNPLGEKQVNRFSYKTNTWGITAALRFAF